MKGSSCNNYHLRTSDGVSYTFCIDYNLLMAFSYGVGLLIHLFSYAFSYGVGLLGSVAYMRMLGSSVDSMADGARGARGLLKYVINDYCLIINTSAVCFVLTTE